MGIQEVHAQGDAQQRRAFMRALLADIRALEHMLQNGMIESGVSRIGSEQELFLIDNSFRPAPIAEQVLEQLNDEHFTTELGRFNLEFNLDPLQFGGDCLRRMETLTARLLDKARVAAQSIGSDVALCGILPSLEKGDLGLHNITDRPRYHALNEALNRIRDNRPYELRIKGIDELNIHHESVMLEACNTSYQVHFQVDPDDFARLYNIAQAVAGPVLAAAVNSPLLFGKRLWRETRIALFQQSIDTRAATEHIRETQARVSFGTKWVEESILEIFQEDIARFKALFSDIDAQDPMEVIKQGRTPRLSALRLHNGTVYRWMRPCYGVSGDKAHLRIENRVLPSGPTVLDEVANSAFWFGLMRGVAMEHGDIAKVMDFDVAHENFLAGARLGLDSQLTWVDTEPTPARQLISERFLPLARAGLESGGIDAGDIDRYLGVIEGRCRTGQTGAAWLLNSLAALREMPSRSGRLAELTRSMVEHQSRNNQPVHEWEASTIPPSQTRERSHFQTIGQFMSTDLFTVNEADIIDLAASLMDWKHVRHIPVEDDQHRLVGLVSHRLLLRHLARSGGVPTEAVPVSEIMISDPVTVTPSTPTVDAMRLMREKKIGCLPVVDNGRLVGIVTEHDFVEIAAPLLEDFLGS